MSKSSPSKLSVTDNLDLKQLRREIRKLHDVLCGDARVQERVKAVNHLLNYKDNFRHLDSGDIDTIWESLFYALWFAEMGRGCEEIIAAIERACRISYRLTKAGFKIIAEKWYGLDQYRLDKVSHLARHLLTVLLDHQIKLWLRSCKHNRNLGTRDIYCKQLLRNTFDNIYSSYGLCYFLLEVLADEINKTLKVFYKKIKIVTGKFELKANLIVFLYKQIISFASSVSLDSRLLSTFDQYVLKKFVEELLPNESQLTQILVSLRLYQSLDKIPRKKKNPSSKKCESLLSQWSRAVQNIHESSINCEHFPVSTKPIAGTIKLVPNKASR